MNVHGVDVARLQHLLLCISVWGMMPTAGFLDGVQLVIGKELTTRDHHAIIVVQTRCLW